MTYARSIRRTWPSGCANKGTTLDWAGWNSSSSQCWTAMHNQCQVFLVSLRAKSSWILDFSLFCLMATIARVQFRCGMRNTPIHEQTLSSVWISTCFSIVLRSTQAWAFNVRKVDNTSTVRVRKRHRLCTWWRCWGILPEPSHCSTGSFSRIPASRILFRTPCPLGLFRREAEQRIR